MRDHLKANNPRICEIPSPREMRSAFLNLRDSV
jgi:hypothetical protein